MSNIPSMSRENAEFWNWLEQKPKHDARKRNAPSFDTTMDNGARVLGNIELNGKFLHLATNSAERAQDGTTLIQQALDDLVRAPLTETRSVEQMMAERPAREKEDPASEIPPKIAEQVVHQFMDRQYRETLNQPVGMLGNKTPRHGREISHWPPEGRRMAQIPRKPVVPAAQPRGPHGNIQFRVDVARTRCP